MQLDDDGHKPRCLVHDRSKFSRAVDSVFESDGITIIHAKIRAPNQLERVLHVYVRHYNDHRPHRALELRAPAAPAEAHSRRQAPPAVAQIRRRQLLGGLIHEYEAA